MKLSIYDQFIPGQWLDNIDVNDFVNLNKKPFFEAPVFLKESSEKTEKLAREMNHFSPRSSQPGTSPLDKVPHETFPTVHSTASFPNATAAKSSTALFDEVATTEIKKALRIGLFSTAPLDQHPSFIHPDVRRIVLYGTKALIKDKKTHLKTLEKHLQTNEWIERRMAIHQEIDGLKAFEFFAKRYRVNVTAPAQHAKEAFSFIYLSLLAAIDENPSVAFSITQIIPFLDIYIEHDLTHQRLSETEAQELVDQLYLRLLCIGLVRNGATTPVLYNETITTRLLTKTTYRYLQAVENFPVTTFPLRVIWSEQTPESFQQVCTRLLQMGIQLSLVNEKYISDKQHTFTLPNGLYGVIGEDILFDGGVMDLEKAFYLALNAGKDVSTSLTLMSVTQPTRKDEIEYEETISKLKDFLAYALNLHAEMANISIYLQETTQPLAFRSALLSNLPFYTVQFGFTQVERVITYLHAIATNQYTIVRNAAGWIERIIPTESISSYDSFLSPLVLFIEKELAKIPFHKSGRAMIRLYQEDEHFTYAKTDAKPLYFTLLPEYTRAMFYHAFQLQNEPIDSLFIASWFAQDFSECRLEIKKTND